MSNSQYEQDVRAWSEQQAVLLRRPGRGERVNDADWDNLAAEIADVGLSELRSVESFLSLILADLMKLQAWPDDAAVDHWCGDIAALQRNAKRRFTPSMRRRIDLQALHIDARYELRAGERRSAVPRPWPELNPFTLDQLLDDDVEALLHHLPAASSA